MVEIVTDRAQQKAYKNMLDTIKSAGVTPGFGIGKCPEGQRIAMKYLLRARETMFQQKTMSLLIPD